MWNLERGGKAGRGGAKSQPATAGTTKPTPNGTSTRGSRGGRGSKRGISSNSGTRSGRSSTNGSVAGDSGDENAKSRPSNRGSRLNPSAKGFNLRGRGGLADATGTPRVNGTSMAAKPRPAFGASAATRMTEEKNRRVAEREQAIRDGILADPDRPRELKDAITPKGICLDMCPEYERLFRMQSNDVVGPEFSLETVDLPRTQRIADEARMVKRFQRSAAGIDEQLPSDLRPPEVLKRTCDYLFDELIVEGKTLGYYHHFLWDRTRAIRNDFSIQQVSAVADVRLAIECFERIVRFHIIALHDLGTLDPKPYDLYDYQQDWEQCDKALLSLTTLYGRSRDRYRSPQEPEFWAYWILFHIQGRLPDTQERIQRLPAEIMADGRVKTALQIFSYAQNNMSNQGEVLFGQEQMPLHLVGAQMNWYKFFALVGSKRTSFLMACCAEVYFHHVRHTALRVLVQSYRRQTQDWTIKDLGQQFHFDSIVDTKAFAAAYGMIPDEDTANESTPLDWTVLGGKNDVSTPAGYPTRVFSDYLVEAKREGRNYSAIIDGMSVANARKAGRIDEPEEEMDDAPVSEDEQSLFVKADVSQSQSVLDQGSNKSNGIFGSPTLFGFGQDSGSATTQKSNLFSQAQVPTSAFGAPAGLAQPSATKSPFQQQSSGEGIGTQTNGFLNGLNGTQSQNHHQPPKSLFNFDSNNATANSIGQRQKQQGDTIPTASTMFAPSHTTTSTAPVFSFQPLTSTSTSDSTTIPPTSTPFDNQSLGLLHPLKPAIEPPKSIFTTTSSVVPKEASLAPQAASSTNSDATSSTVSPFKGFSFTNTSTPSHSIFSQPTATPPPSDQPPTPSVLSASITSTAPFSILTATQSSDATPSLTPQPLLQQPSPAPSSTLKPPSSSQQGNQLGAQPLAQANATHTVSPASIFSVKAGSTSLTPAQPPKKHVTFDFATPREQLPPVPPTAHAKAQFSSSAITTTPALLVTKQAETAKAVRHEQAMEYLSRQLVMDLDHGAISRIVRGTIGDWVRAEIRSNQIAKWKARAKEIEMYLLSKKFCKLWYEKWRRSRMRLAARKRREHLKDSLRRSQSRSVSVIDEFKAIRADANKDPVNDFSKSADDSVIPTLQQSSQTAPPARSTGRQSIRKTAKARQASTASVSELPVTRGSNCSMPNLATPMKSGSPLGHNEMLIKSIRGPPRPDGKVSTTKTPYFQWKARGLLGNSLTSNSLRSSTSSSGLRDSVRSNQEPNTSHVMSFSSPVRPPPVSSVAAGKRKLEDAADDDQERRKRTTHAPHSSVDIGDSVALRRVSLNSSTTSLAEKGQEEYNDIMSRARTVQRELEDAERSIIEMRQNLEQGSHHGPHDFVSHNHIASPLRSLPAYHFRNSKFVPRRMYGKWSPKTVQQSPATAAVPAQAHAASSPLPEPVQKIRPFGVRPTSSNNVMPDAQQPDMALPPSKTDIDDHLQNERDQPAQSCLPFSGVAHAARVAAEMAGQTLRHATYNGISQTEQPLFADNDNLYEDSFGQSTLPAARSIPFSTFGETPSIFEPRRQDFAHSALWAKEVDGSDDDGEGEVEDEDDEEGQDGVEESEEEEIDGEVGGYEDEDDEDEDLEGESGDDLVSDDYDEEEEQEEEEDDDEEDFDQRSRYGNPVHYGSRQPAPAPLDGPGASAADAIELDSD